MSDSGYNSSGDMAQYRYAVRNTYMVGLPLHYLKGTARQPSSVAMNNMFNSRYTTIQFATTQAGLVITPIINEVNPEMKTNMLLSDISNALTAGLAVLGFPEVSAANKGAVSVSTTLVANIVSKGIQQAPSVAKAIWPVGTASSQNYQIGELDAGLEGVNSDLSDRINAGLQEIMIDDPSFLAFASNGSFSGSTLPSFPAQTDGLNIGFKTYLVIFAMPHNSWRGSWTDLQTTSTGPQSNPPVTFGPTNTAQVSQSLAFGCDC